MDRPSSPAFAAEFWHDEALRLRKTLEQVQRDLEDFMRYETSAQIQLVQKAIHHALKDRASRGAGQRGEGDEWLSPL